ncbi:MAG: hypothetical protein MZV63_16770 [Marinilabiliales bacterium]|nr:hypothetical protein [Marinilabiliales bacterium]
MGPGRHGGCQFPGRLEALLARDRRLRVPGGEGRRRGGRVAPGARLRVALGSRAGDAHLGLLSRRAAAIETWTTFEPFQTGSSVTLSDIGVWQLTVGGSAVNWVTGLASPIAGDAPFTRKRAPLGGEPVARGDGPRHHGPRSGGMGRRPGQGICSQA